MMVQSEMTVNQAKNIFSSKPSLQGLAKQLFTFIYVPADSKQCCKSGKVRSLIKSLLHF
jgi:hypothetical protein